MKDKIDFTIIVIERDIANLQKEKMDENTSFGEAAAIHIELEKLKHTLQTLKNLLK